MPASGATATRSRDFNRAVQLDPNYAPAYTNRGARLSGRPTGTTRPSPISAARSRPTRITARPISAAATCCARRVSFQEALRRPHGRDPPDARIGRGAPCPRAALPAPGRPPAGDPRLRRRDRPQSVRRRALRRPRARASSPRASSTRRSRISTPRSTSTTGTRNPGPGAASPTSGRAAARRRSRASSAPLGVDPQQRHRQAGPRPRQRRRLRAWQILLQTGVSRHSSGPRPGAA